jgi:hypothetical protein
MATHARITSIEALERFRASLIIFLNKSRSSIDQVTDEIRRTRSWIQNDQRTHWESEARKRARTLAQAEQELLSARMTKALDNLSAQQLAVKKARHALEEAADKVRLVKRWIRDFDGTVEPMVKGLNSMRGYLDHDLPHGIAHLAETSKIMEDYMEVAKPAAPRSDAPAPALTEAPKEPKVPAQPL